jgi:hypothetical protein
MSVRFLGTRLLQFLRNSVPISSSKDSVPKLFGTGSGIYRKYRTCTAVTHWAQEANEVVVVVGGVNPWGTPGSTTAGWDELDAAVARDQGADELSLSLSLIQRTYDNNGGWTQR